MSASAAFILGVMFGTASLSAAVLAVSNRTRRVDAARRKGR